MGELVKLEALGGGISRLTLNDPDTRNAMSEEMAEQFHRLVSGLGVDAQLRALIITGAGQAFSGGGHLDMLAGKTKLSKRENKKLMQSFYEQFLSILTLDVPIIAAINGHAMGAALCLALACDIRLASRSAKMGLNFVQIGLHPGMGATFFLPRVVGFPRASELLYTGKILTADEAHNIGLVHAVHDGDQLNAAVQTVAETISSAGPQAVRQLKDSLRFSYESSLGDCLSREAACQAENYAGAEFLEGISAAREKRKPKF